MKHFNLFMALVILLVLGSGLLGADEVTVRLESRIIETWDGPDSGYFPDTGQPISWQLRGSKFSAPGKPKLAYAMNEWPVDLFGVRPENPENLGVFGINGAFIRQGYNQIELIPGVGSGEDFIPKTIALPGRVHTLDFWAWGSNYDFYIEFFFRDYQGIAHRLFPFRNENLSEPGSLKFVGWKNMFITMPNYIKQVSNYIQVDTTLSLTKIVITTHPEEIVSDFYIYLDHLKILTDIHDTRYDGFGLTDTQRISEIWETGE